MAHPRSLFAPLSRCTAPFLLSSRSELPRLASTSYQTIRCASKVAPKKKKKARTTFIDHDLKKMDQFALLDAIHYIRAFEVGRNPASVKYEVAVRLKTIKNGPVVRNRMRLPHPVKTDLRICVIAAPDSKAAAEARREGASLVGEDEVFAQIKEGKIDFDRCICHIDSLQKMNKAGLGRILGPKGLMPSTKAGTVVSSVESIVRNMISGTEYRERLGVIRLAVGQLGFTPEELQSNIKAFIEAMKLDMARMSDRATKDIGEVVLSSTNGPGFSLNGEFRGPNSLSPRELSGPL
ncbi:ribosomal protein L1 [Pyrenochaeta sp. DS3sAY3a]|nr:ribosomal protein L1 [Pyrenochaeta sp. DS3sAY3a]